MKREGLSRRQFLQVSAAAGLAAAAPLRTAAEAADTKSLRVRAYTNFETLDPAFRLGAPEGDIMDAIFLGLVTVSPGTTWGWEKDAALSIEQADPTHIRFQLRPGIPWSQGFGELSAEDVKYSYERIANPAMKSPYRGDWAKLERVEVTGRHAGVIVLKEPFLPLWSSTLPQSSSVIVCKKAVEKMDGQRFTMDPGPSCGPYQIQKWEPRAGITLVRNPLWPGPKPAFEEIQSIPILDVNAAEIAYEAGQIDATHVPMTSIPRLRGKLPANSTLDARPGLTYWWLGMQMETGIFADARVRKAVQLAVDVKSLLDGAFFGVAPRSTGIVAPGLVGHRDKNLIPGPDLDKARKLLAEAGHPRGFKTEIGVRNSTEFINAGQVVAASLAKVGIQAEVAPFDSGVQKAMASDKAGGWKKMQMHVSRFSMQPDPSWATVWFTTAQIGEWNWERWSSKEYDTLHEQALQETDQAKRHAMYVRMQDLMEESGAYLFLTHGVNAVLYRNHLKAALTPDGNRMLLRKFQLTA
jgi:peptide/nickel transport system substrate-binding protein